MHQRLILRRSKKQSFPKLEELSHSVLSASKTGLGSEPVDLQWSKKLSIADTIHNMVSRFREFVVPTGSCAISRERMLAVYRTIVYSYEMV